MQSVLDRLKNYYGKPLASALLWQALVHYLTVGMRDTGVTHSLTMKLSPYLWLFLLVFFILRARPTRTERFFFALAPLILHFFILFRPRS